MIEVEIEIETDMIHNHEESKPQEAGVHSMKTKSVDKTQADKDQNMKLPTQMEEDEMEDATDSTENTSMQLASQAGTPIPTFTFQNQDHSIEGGLETSVTKLQPRKRKLPGVATHQSAIEKNKAGLKQQLKHAISIELKSKKNSPNIIQQE